jgi:5'-3' exonuclease
MDKVLLIDFMNAVFRSAFSFGKKDQEHRICPKLCLQPKHRNELHCVCSSPWINSGCSADQYGFIYNFFRAIPPLIEQFKPAKMIFVLEGHPKHRLELFADYKGNRIKTASQNVSRGKVFKIADMIKDLLLFCPITLARAADYEADDVIGALCSNMLDEQVVIVSNDSDFIQLLQRGYKHLSIFDPRKKEMMVAPSYPYIAWKALAGDKADNIPRLTRSDKAIKLVNSPTLFQQWLSSSEENRSNFSINRKLIELSDVPLDDIIFTEGYKNYDKLQVEFAQMRFDTLISDETWDRFVSTFERLIY